MLLHKEMTIGQRFKHFRLQAGMSQAELTEGICSVAVVSHIETDRSIPSAHTLGKLAERLCVPLREIMGMQETKMGIGFQIEMIRVYNERGDAERALEIIEKLVQNTDLLEHQRVDLLISRAESYIKTNKFAEAVEILLPFVEQQDVQQTIDDELLCDVYNKLGRAHFKSNDFERAFSAFERGYRISLRLPTFNLVSARVTKNLGLTCNQLGLKDEARRYLEKSKKFYESMSDLTGVANTLFELAIATGEEVYMTSAHTLYESMNMLHQANVVMQHYAFYVESNRNYTGALRKFDSTIEWFEKIGDLGMCVYTSSRAAMVSLDQDDIREAKKYLHNAEQFKERIVDGNDYLFVDYYKSKAMLHLKQENYDQCILDLQITSQICDKMGLYADSAIALELHAEALHRKGEHEEAYLIAKKAFDLLRLRRGV